MKFWFFQVAKFIQGSLIFKKYYLGLSCEAHEKLYVARSNILGAFLHSEQPDVLVLALCGFLVDYMLKVYPD